VLVLSIFQLLEIVCPEASTIRKVTLQMALEPPFVNVSPICMLPEELETTEALNVRPPEPDGALVVVVVAPALVVVVVAPALVVVVVAELDELTEQQPPLGQAVPILFGGDELQRT